MRPSTRLAHDPGQEVRVGDAPPGRIEKDPEVALEQIKLALDDYVVCVQGEFFGLPDLEGGETIEAVRGKAGHYTMTRLDLPALEKKFSSSKEAELLTWLGHLAYFQSHDCGDAAPEDAGKAKSFYERARMLGAASPRLRRNLGLLYLEDNDAPKAIPLFKASAAEYASDPQFQYNFAYALFLDKNSRDAAEPAETAVRLYKDKKLISEASASMATWKNGREPRR